MKKIRWSVRFKIAASNALVLAALWGLTFIGLRLLVFRLMDIALNEELRVLANSVVAEPVKEAPDAKNSPVKIPSGLPALPVPEYIIDSSQVKPTSPGAAGRLEVRPTGNHKLKLLERDPSVRGIMGSTGRPDEYLIVLNEESQEARSESTAEPFKVYETPLIVDGNEVGIVTASWPLDEIDRLRKSVDAAMRIVFPAGLFLVAACGWWSTGRALRPVKRITEAAAEVSSDNLSFRFPKGPDDEFARLAGSFNYMFERLEHSFDAQSRFVSDASHELKTPLSIVKANLEWMKSSAKLEDSQRESLNDALEASTRMQLLIDDLLVLAKADSSVIAEAETRSNVLEVCSDCLQSLMKREPNLLITVDVDKSHTVAVKEQHFYRILINLIDNACRYGDDGSAVTVTSKEGVGTVSIFITNQGEVIDSEVLARLGERFYRPDDSRTRSTGGTGLGLAISKRLCELYGGKLFLSSSAESGTVVELRLPVG